MDCCLPVNSYLPLNFCLSNHFKLCDVCYNPCSIFEIKLLEEDTIICNECYNNMSKAKLNPENRKAQSYGEKYKWYSDNELYSIRGPYVLNKWGQIVGDIVNNSIKMRTFLNDICFLCRGPVSTLKETYITGYLYHYECSKLCVL